jgi:hypothetical protein
VPSAPVDEEAKKRNGNLPGQGGVFNYVNLHVYHYAGNNPVKYTDPDGNADKLTTEQWNDVKEAKDMVVKDLNDMIQELRDVDSGKLSAVSQRMKEGAEAFLGVSFSLPYDYKELAKRLTKVKDSLEKMTDNDFRYNNKTNSYAYYNPITGKMVLGKAFFNSPLIGNDTRQGTLVHETTHKVLSTNIIFWAEKYDMNVLQNLPIDPTNKRDGHANSWEYFYEYVKNNGGKK